MTQETLYILVLIPVLVIAVAVFVFIIFNYLGFFTGAPYSATPYHVVNKLFDIVKVGQQDVVYDLGSGDGRILIAAGEQGADAFGWEINHPLYLFSKRKVSKRGLDNKIKINYGDFWKHKLSGATVIFAFLLSKYMARLEKKLERETSPGTLVVTYKAKFDKRLPIKETDDGLHVYYF